MCKSAETGDLELRFQARFGGPERSGITLAVVSMTQVRGTRRRRALKRGKNTFPQLFGSFFGAPSRRKSHNNKSIGFGTYTPFQANLCKS